MTTASADDEREEDEQANAGIPRRVAGVVASTLGVRARDVEASDFELTSARAFSSFALLELILRLEAEFGISIPDHDLDMERFRTVEAISAYVRERNGF